MDKQEKDEYRFVKEQIKQKPADKKDFGMRVCRVAILGCVFGVLAALVFCLTQPAFENLFSGRDQRVNLPEENEPSISAEEEEPPEPEPIYITETQQMELADYQILQNKLYGVGKEANKSVVAVTGVKSSKDWFDSDYETQGQGAGIIIADTNQRFLIVTERKLIADAEHIKVAFYNDTTVDAELIAHDGNTGIAVLGVEKRSLSEPEREQIKVAELGSSGMVSQGTMVIAIGSPLGEVYSILTGNVTSANNEITTLDANYKVITTDIIGTENSSGALLNLEGRVVGLIMQGYGNESHRNTVTAIGISDLRDLIERLSNGESPVYLGMEISTVTEEISKEYDLPMGVYVKEVQMESPAIEAGIQAGDVIIRMNDENVLTEAQYEEFLKKVKNGQELSVTVMRMGSDGDYQEVICNPVLNILN